MSLISHNRLKQLIEQGVIEVDLANLNGASIDITMDSEIMIESSEQHDEDLVDLAAKQSPRMIPYRLQEGSAYILRPGEFILASSKEVFNLPADIAAEYKLKSSLARSGLQHLMAGWCDPGWYGSKLTLELKNVSRYHKLLIRPGMKIGQMVFWSCDPVPEGESYATKGQYNNQETVVANKGLR